MPQAPKSPQTKKPGAPKAKGAVRAKSGCYTCRIRRKKCDERANQDGHCETCVRLRLQCLGFGAKRPEWLRDSHNVIEMRDKIKGFLAAQGMLKGHSGSGPRGADHALPVLQLEGDRTPSSSESPPTPTLSLSPSEPPRSLQHDESAMRDQPGWMGIDYPTSHASLLNPMRGGSPPFGGPHSSHDMIYPASSYNSNSIVSWNPLSRSPALTSSISPIYNYSPDDQDMYYPSMEDDELSPHAVPLPGWNTYMIHKPGGQNDDLVHYYIGNVMGLQYLLADNNYIYNILVPSVTKNGASSEAAQILASVHHQRRMRQSNSYMALQETTTKTRYDQLQKVLTKTRYTEDDALAAISLVSSFLFDGGVGSWHKWLAISYAYADSVFRGRDPADVLQTCSKTTQFIIKTAIWFDVLAAITTQRSPRFLHYIRKLFSPIASGITALDPALSSPAELSMLDVMGCENHVVWVLAEASALAVWKREQMAKGCLSVPDLVSRAAEFDRPYLDPPMQQPAALTDKDRARATSAELFRTGTRVYLRSIVSGDFPHVSEIREAVEEAMELVRRPRIESHVVRSTVFTFFVVGALTDDTALQNEVYTKLSLDDEDVATSSVGNSASIRKLLQQLWAARTNSSASSPVEWRDLLRRSELLLV